jgi:hypothetical protein
MIFLLRIQRNIGGHIYMMFFCISDLTNSGLIVGGPQIDLIFMGYTAI